MFESSINIAYSIVIAVNFFLGTAIFVDNPKGPTNRFFFFFILTGIGWIITLFFYYAVESDLILTLGRVNFAFAALTTFALYNFVRLFLQKEFSRLDYVLALETIVLVSMIFWTPWVVKAELIENNLRITEFGLGYILFICHVIGTSVLAFGLLIQRYFIMAPGRRNSSGVTFLALGIVLSVSLSITTNIILPYFFGNYELQNLAPLFTILLFAFAAYAIGAKNLFNLKVVSTELFAFTLWTVLYVRLLLSDAGLDIWLNSTALTLSIVIGMFLIRSVIKEVEARSEIQRLASNLQIANDKLKELDKLKSQFLSIATHELRTPLTIVRNFISLMLDGSYGKVAPAAEEAGRLVFDRVNDMARSIDTYLNVSKIEQGKISYSFAPGDVTHLVQLAVQGLKANADKKNLALTCTVVPGAEKLQANIDSPKITEVLVNLIDNSIKYTPTGSVAVAVEKVGQRARVTIKDTGVGMTEKTKANLFKLFSPGEDSKKINPASTGVGLYVSLAHVQAHKGTLTALSDGQGKGSTFVLEIPLV